MQDCGAGFFDRRNAIGVSAQVEVDLAAGIIIEQETYLGR